MESNNAPAQAAGDTVLANACNYSRYARRILEAEPQLATRVAIEVPAGASAMRARLDALLAEGEALPRALRALRKEVMLVLIARDLAGRAELAEVVGATTALAELAIETATAAVQAELAAQYGEPVGEATGTPQQLHVVGMGKLGGGELNVSSDVDLILLYPEE